MIVNPFEVKEETGAQRSKLRVIQLWMEWPRPDWVFWLQSPWSKTCALTNLYNQEVFIQHLLHARHCSGYWGYVNEQNRLFDWPLGAWPPRPPKKTSPGERGKLPHSSGGADIHQTVVQVRISLQVPWRTWSRGSCSSLRARSNFSQKWP